VHRTESNGTQVLSAIKASVQFLHKYPDLFSGYDIVGDEDKGNSLLSYIDELLYPSQNNIDLPYFFHAGETSTNLLLTSIIGFVTMFCDLAILFGSVTSISSLAL